MTNLNFRAAALLLALAGSLVIVLAAGPPPSIVLATTTSTQDSGLLDDLIPPFEAASGMTVKLIAVGSGQALALGERGEADRLLVHFEGDPALRNVYHLIVVNPKQGPRVNRDGAVTLARFLPSQVTEARVAAFGRARFGRPLFMPDMEPFGPATELTGERGAPPR